MIIYLCAFKNKIYIEEAKLCIRSIREKGEFNGKIYLFTDIDIEIDGVDIIRTLVSSVPYSASYRMRFFEHIPLKDLDCDEPILYLDTDIIVTSKIPDFTDIDNKI